MENVFGNESYYYSIHWILSEGGKEVLRKNLIRAPDDATATARGAAYAEGHIDNKAKRARLVGVYRFRA